MKQTKPIQWWKSKSNTKSNSIWNVKPRLAKPAKSIFPAKNKYRFGKPANLFGDRDKDGVMNVFDCKPLNRWKQGFLLRQDIKRRLGLDMTRKELRQERLLGKKLLKKKMYVSNTPHKKQSTEDIISFFEKNPHMIKTADQNFQMNMLLNQKHYNHMINQHKN